jgi:hypothetical protein
MEPSRTERLLSRPFALRHTHGSDAIDSIRLFWLAKSGGGLTGVTYDYLKTFSQLFIATTVAIGHDFDACSRVAVIHAGFTIGSFWLVALYVFKCRPSSDRIDNLSTIGQFACEGASVLLGLIACEYVADERGGLLMGRFMLSLVAVSFPVLMKLYDAVVVTLSKICRGEELSCARISFACAALILAIPSIFFAFEEMPVDNEMESVCIECVTGDAEDSAIVFDKAGEVIEEGADQFTNAADLAANAQWQNAMMAAMRRKRLMRKDAGPFGGWKKGFGGRLSGRESERQSGIADDDAPSPSGAGEPRSRMRFNFFSSHPKRPASISVAAEGEDEDRLAAPTPDSCKRRGKKVKANFGAAAAALDETSGAALTPSRAGGRNFDSRGIRGRKGNSRRSSGGVNFAVKAKAKIAERYLVAVHGNKSRRRSTVTSESCTEAGPSSTP